MFAYCGNNPINACDPTGYLFEWVDDAWDWITEAASDVGEAIWDGLTAAGRGICIASGWCADREADVFSFVGLNGLEWFERDVVAEFWWGLAGGRNDNYKQQNAPQGLTTLYRSVSQAEAESIMTFGRFTTIPGSFEAKQFGFSLEEVRRFGTWANQSIVVAVDIPTSALSQFDLTQVDKIIFRSGTLTVSGAQLDLFNSMIVGEIRIIE